jgi:hypothetical protein
MSRGVRRDDQVREVAVKALQRGQSVREVAAALSIPQGTVASWSRQVHTDAPQKKSGDLGWLVGDYLSTGLRSMTTQVQQLGTPDCVRQLSAREIAMLHGSLADRLFSLISRAT